MLIAGSDDGVYRLPDDDSPGDATAIQTLESGRVMRVRTVDAFEGVFAATTTGLFHSTDGESWVDLGVPSEQVYAVGATPEGRLYAGTRPAHVYEGTFEADSGASGAADLESVEWRDCVGFQALPSREEWRLPRHEDLAQVRDVHFDPADRGRIVAGVEVGGVHVSDDGGATWSERRTGVDDDVHELRVVGPGDYVAATGFCLFRSTDGGDSWTRLDEGFDQRYFRSVCAVGDVVYAGGALAHSSTWDDPDADPALFAIHGNEAEPVAFPRSDETVTGMTAVGADLVAATHAGSVVRYSGGEWNSVGTLPVSDELTGRYTPLVAYER